MDLNVDAPWPYSADDATCPRVAASYAAEVVELQRRVLDEPFPDVPRDPAEQTPEHRAQLQAYADKMCRVVNAYAAALMVRRFHAAAPEAAAEACRELWLDLDAGDSLGEMAWEWLHEDSPAGFTK